MPRNDLAKQLKWQGRNAVPENRQQAGDSVPFWKAKNLEEMTVAEWEALCDGCGRCCLIKLEDEDTGDIAVTRLACKLLDLGSCRCTGYSGRRDQVADCVKLTPEDVRSLAWLPETCAYRLIDEGRELPWWHPLISGTAESVHEAGVSVRGAAIGENKVPQNRFPAHIMGWIKPRKRR
ncbi:MAG: YcgN family cysteine cluster protein [Rhodomicrobium sp.]